MGDFTQIEFLAALEKRKKDVAIWGSEAHVASGEPVAKHVLSNTHGPIFPDPKGT